MDRGSATFLAFVIHGTETMPALNFSASSLASSASRDTRTTFCSIQTWGSMRTAYPNSRASSVIRFIIFPFSRNYHLDLVGTRIMCTQSVFGIHAKYELKNDSFSTPKNVYVYIVPTANGYRASRDGRWFVWRVPQLRTKHSMCMAVPRTTEPSEIAAAQFAKRYRNQR